LEARGACDVCVPLAFVRAPKLAQEKRERAKRITHVCALYGGLVSFIHARRDLSPLCVNVFRGRPIYGAPLGRQLLFKPL
jgi:hypothetical protein